jgi:vacuolar-type H+-ATPase subunit E/Vma4
LYRAEQTYNQALKLIGEHRYDEARRLASEAKHQYKTLIRNAHSNAKKNVEWGFEDLQKGRQVRYQRSENVVG